MSLSITSWNTNGLRATYNSGFWDEILLLNSDIICLQETKSELNQLPEGLRNQVGYHLILHPSSTKRGYSGTAIFSKTKPNDIVFGLPNKPELDQEGRTITAYYDDFILITCYFPNGGGGPERLQYKLDFYNEFLEYINGLRESNVPVIFCGDVNTAHNEIDLARPKANEQNTGFLRIERDWLDKVLTSGWIDVFRTLHPEKIEYTWWDMKTRARERDIGWRIDYFFINQEHFPLVRSIKHHQNLLGSDHCPISISLTI